MDLPKKTIYVTQAGTRIHRLDGMIAASTGRSTTERWAPEELERMLLFGAVQVTTQALTTLLRSGVGVSLFSPSGKFRGHLASPESGSVFLRLAQHARFGELNFRLDFAKEVIRLKVYSGRAQLRRFARNHPEARGELEPRADRLDAALDAVSKAPDLDVLRGVEGAAAAAYFEAFAHMVRAPFCFDKRSRRPARDPVNALLNLGYTLLTNELASALEGAGFDPRIGYFHGVRYGRASLALDLCEVHRVDVIDRLTLALLNRRVMSPGDFLDKGGELGVRLTPEALRRYLGHYEAALGEPGEQAPSPRERFAAQVTTLRRQVLARPPEAVVPEDARVEAGA